MKRILELAGRLGEAVAEHAHFKALRSAREALKNDDDAQTIQREYDEAGEVLRQKLNTGQPLEPEEKRLETELRAKVTGNAVLMNMLRAQADFHEMMQQVNAAIEDKTQL